MRLNIADYAVNCILVVLRMEAIQVQVSHDVRNLFKFGMLIHFIGDGSVNGINGRRAEVSRPILFNANRTASPEQGFSNPAPT
jgi:hypothetical protein